MLIKRIKMSNDILEFMRNNIKYWWCRYKW